MPDGGNTIIIQGKKRFSVDAVTSTDPYFTANVKAVNDEPFVKDESFDAQIAALRELTNRIIELNPQIPNEASIIIKNVEDPSFLINFTNSNLNTDLAEKQKLLENTSLPNRAEKLIEVLQKELQFAELKNKVHTKTKVELDKQQRDYFLNQQLKSIKDELGGDNNDREIAEMKKEELGKIVN